MSFSTPVGLIIFNRPDLTEKVFAAIAHAKPKKLFVVADGPRLDRPGETDKCDKTRSIIQKIDWDCELFTNFSESNMGCGRREASGLDWIFSQVEEAIILEDDTFPAPSFFTYCQELLARYRHDERVMTISGNNFQGGQTRTDYSYYFSKYHHTWGWATWRRAWQYYDYHMSLWPLFRDSKFLDLVCDNPYELQYWQKIFEQMYVDPSVIDTWDYQWTFTCWAQSGLSISPNENLISNIGFNRADAAHTTGESSFANLPTSNLYELKHPPFVLKERNADSYTFDNVFGGNEIRNSRRIQVRLHNKLSRIMRKILVPNMKK